MLDPANKEEVRKFGCIASKYAYTEHKEMVRVATVKSVAKVLERIEITNGPELHDLYYSVILILHDEHPEIRLFLV